MLRASIKGKAKIGSFSVEAINYGLDLRQKICVEGEQVKSGQ